jgi:glucosyl-dolichyl phosphate glucuronosyltransferase
VTRPAPTVSVIVCAYTMRRWDDVQSAVESVRAQPEDPEVVLVIDHSDELLAAARDRWPELRVIPNTGERGLSGARNTGVAAATGDIVAFLDDDASAEDGWLAPLLAPFADADVVGVGGFAEPIWPTATGSGPYPDELLWIVGCSYTGLPTEFAEVRNVIGCSMAFRRASILAAGGFSSGIGRVGTHPLGCEETDLCIRIRQVDPTAKIHHEPRSRVRHRVSDDRVTMDYVRKRSYYEGISKAVLSRRLGRKDSLSSESAYLTKVLPGALLRELTHPRNGGLGRATAIVVTVATIITGYAVGTVIAPRVAADPVPVPGRAGSPSGSAAGSASGDSTSDRSAALR